MNITFEYLFKHRIQIQYYAMKYVVFAIANIESQPRYSKPKTVGSDSFFTKSMVFRRKKSWVLGTTLFAEVQR